MSVSRDHYYKLASDREDERIGAAVQLINELNQAANTAEWEYAIQRLIKGLSSSRGSARIGFSTALTEIVNIRYSQKVLSLQELMKLINEHTKVSSAMNGKEERAALFGKLFGLQCISNANSGVFNNEIRDEDFKLFVDNLIDLSCTKSWIREPSLYTVFTLLKAVYPKLSDDLVFYVFQKLDEKNLSLSTEGLALYFAVPQTERSKLAQLSFKNPTWKNANPLHTSNLALLTRVLKNISTGDESSEDENNKKKGSWSPRLHFVWQMVVSELSSEVDSFEEQVNNSKKRKKSYDKKSKKSKSNDKSSVTDSLQIAEFWKVIIDESFFSEKSSNERKYWGFEVFELFYAHSNSDVVASLFTQNFMRTLINHSSDSNRMLNKIAKKTLRTISEVGVAQPLKVVPTLECLLTGPYGSFHFDRLTKSKTVEQLLSANASNLSMANIFISVLKKDIDDKETKLKTHKWAIDQLLHLVRTKKGSMEKNSDIEWIDTILKALILEAFFKQTGTEEDEKDLIVKFAQERLNSILSDVISIHRSDKQSWSFKTLNSLLDFANGGEQPLLKFDEELEIVKNKSLKILKKIRSKRESQHSDSSRLLVFELLFSMVVLQLYSGDAESVNTLEELQDYYYANKKAEDEDDQEDSILGIVEILMNFLSQKSSLLKKLSLIIWENWCDKVNLEGLQLLFDVIATKENREGQKALFEGEDEFVDEDEEEHDHSHYEDGEEEEEDDDEGDGSESESDDEEDDEEVNADEAVAEVEKKTNVALAEALRIPHNGEVVLSSDDEDISDESMDDEQMMEIDGQLSKIFQQRRDALNEVQTGNKRKQEKEDAKESIILFKHRVVDLIDVYVKKNPNSELVIDMVSPLLMALKITLDKSLGVKIHKLLKNRICKSKPQIKEASPEKLLGLLSSIHEDAIRTSNTNDFNLSSSQCSIFIAKQVISIDEKAMDQIIDMYTNLLKHWWKKKNARLTSSIFFDFINWMNSKRSN